MILLYVHYLMLMTGVNSPGMGHSSTGGQVGGAGGKHETLALLDAKLKPSRKLA